VSVSPQTEAQEAVVGFSIELPARVRMVVAADSQAGAESIIRAILGDGGWIKCDPDCGGIQFGLRVP